MRLTGRTAYRKSLFGKMVLTVEEGWNTVRFGRGLAINGWTTSFRDATAEDVLKLELIALDPSRAAKPDESDRPPPPRR